MKGVDLRGAILIDGHLEGAMPFFTDLEGATPIGAHLERAFLLEGNS